MIAEYFRAVWYLSVVDGFYIFMSFLFKKMENVYIHFVNKNRLVEEDIKSLSNKEFKKIYLKLFKLYVKRGKFRIKSDYYGMKFCEKQKDALDILYELNRTAQSNGYYIQSKTPIVDSYLEAKKNYEISVENYESSVKALNNYIQSVANIFNV